MKIQMLRQYDALQTISVISMYGKVYNVSLTKIELPAVRTKISGVKVQAICQDIQHKWLESATCRTWSTDDFIQLSFQITNWIESCPEVCENEASWEYWWASLWKRGAQDILRLRTIEE